jgi:histidinol dehydrogenase/sulfopropanediol 3-dehydrogenase
MAAVEEQLETLATAEVAGAAWENEGTVVVCDDIAEATAAVDGVAPEHLEIHTADPRGVLEWLSNYGSAFLGEDSAVVFSDKCAGTNHVLPTAGAAAHTAGLSVFEFLKPLTHQEVTPEGADRLRPWAVAQSRRERLEGHAKSAHLRGDEATLANYEATAYTPGESGNGNGNGSEDG